MVFFGALWGLQSNFIVIFLFILVAKRIWILFLGAIVLARELLVFGGGCQLSCIDSKALSFFDNSLLFWNKIILFCYCLWQ